MRIYARDRVNFQSRRNYVNNAPHVRACAVPRYFALRRCYAGDYDDRTRMAVKREGPPVCRGRETFPPPPLPNYISNDPRVVAYAVSGSARRGVVLAEIASVCAREARGRLPRFGATSTIIVERITFAGQRELPDPDGLSAKGRWDHAPSVGRRGGEYPFAVGVARCRSSRAI